MRADLPDLVLAILIAIVFGDDLYRIGEVLGERLGETIVDYFNGGNE